MTQLAMLVILSADEIVTLIQLKSLKTMVW